MGLNSRKSGQSALGRAVSRQPGSSLRVCRVGLFPGSELRCVRGHAEPLVFSALSAPALPGGPLPHQAHACVSSLSCVCLGWAGEERPLLLCCVGADGEESPPLPSLLKHKEGGLLLRWSGCKPELGRRLLCLVFGCCRVSAVSLWDSAELPPFRCL